MIYDTPARPNCEAHLQALPYPDDSEYDGDTEVLENLVRQPAIEIAIDTEYQDSHTLTIQAATRLGTDIVVQVYHSGDISPPPLSFRVRDYMPRDFIRCRLCPWCRALCESEDGHKG